MASPPQLTHLAFAAGLNEGQQGEVLDPTSGFLALQNVRQERAGAVEKRLGFRGLSTWRVLGEPRSAGRRLLSYRGAPCVIDGTHLDRYSDSVAVSAVASRVPEASVTTRPLVSVSNPRRLQAVHPVGNYLVTACFAEVDADGISGLMVGVETADGASVRIDRLDPTAAWGDTDRSAEVSAEVCSHGNRVYVFLREPLRAQIWLWQLDVSSLSTIAAGWFDAGAWTIDAYTQAGIVPSRTWATASLDEAVALAYRNEDDEIVVLSINEGGLVASATVSPATPPRAVALAASAETLWLAWDEPDIYVQAFSPSSLAVTGSAGAVYSNPGSPIGMHILPTTSGAGRLFLNAAPDEQMRSASFHVASGAVVDDVPGFIEGAWLQSRAFRHAGRQYAVCHGPTSVNSSDVAVLCDVSAEGTLELLRPVASMYPGLAVAPERTIRPWAVSSTRYAWPVQVRRSAVQTAAELVTFDFADRARWRPAEHNGAVYLSGGVLSYYDGDRVAEASFLYSPNKPELTADPPLVEGVSRKYVATYEEADAAGNWSVSGVSEPSDLVTLDTTDPEVLVSVYGLAISGRKRVRVCFYATLNGGEPPYYFLAERPNDAHAVVSFVDDLTVSDAVLKNRRKLYAPNLPGTTPGEAQDRRAPPFCTDVVSYSDMLVTASGRELWWSGQTISGEGAWFSPLFSLPVGDADRISAIAVQDGALYVFTRRSIWSCAGDAPNDAGTQGGLSFARRVSTDAGCVDPCSVVSTSLGIFFRSERGLELLTRSQSVEYIGEAIQRTLAAFPVVTSAVLDDRHGLVRFTLAEAESAGAATGTGRVAVFDLSLKLWVSIDVLVSEQAAQDAAMVRVDGTWRCAWLNAEGRVRTENLATDEDAHLDDQSVWITMAAETAWFKLGGLQGQQHVNHVMLLARKTTDHGLSLSLAYNYEEAFREAREWSFDTINSLLSTGWPVTQLKHEPHDDAKCQAMRLRIEDHEAAASETEPGGDTATGKGSTWIGLTLDITPKPGVFDVPEEAA